MGDGSECVTALASERVHFVGSVRDSVGAADRAAEAPLEPPLPLLAFRLPLHPPGRGGRQLGSGRGAATPSLLVPLLPAHLVMALVCEIVEGRWRWGRRLQREGRLSSSMPRTI